MRLDALLLADAVSAPADGKFYLHGGGITRFTVPVLPFTVPQIGVFVRLEVDEAEFRTQHRFRLSMIDPGGVFAIPPQEFPAGPFEAAALEPGEERYVALALNMGGVTFGQPGLYRFEFHIDGDLVRSVPLPVIAIPADQLQALQAQRPDPSPSPNRAARRQAQRKRGSA